MVEFPVLTAKGRQFQGSQPSLLGELYAKQTLAKKRNLQFKYFLITTKKKLKKNSHFIGDHTVASWLPIEQELIVGFDSQNPWEKSR